MINLRVTNSLDRKDIEIKEDVTIRQALEQSGIKHNNSALMLNGFVITPEMYDKTFNEVDGLNTGGLNLLVAVVKAKSA